VSLASFPVKPLAVVVMSEGHLRPIISEILAQQRHSTVKHILVSITRFFLDSLSDWFSFWNFHLSQLTPLIIMMTNRTAKQNMPIPITIQLNE
jgi:hypothetical protein